MQEETSTTPGRISSPEPTAHTDYFPGLTVDELEKIRREQPAIITQGDWELLRWRVWDTWRAIHHFETEIKPVLERMASGKFSLASLIMGGKHGG